MYIAPLSTNITAFASLARRAFRKIRKKNQKHSNKQTKELSDEPATRVRSDGQSRSLFLFMYDT